MKTNFNNTYQSAKKIAETLKLINSNNFGSIGQMKEQLKEKGCPYAGPVATYLAKNKYLNKSKNGNFYYFIWSSDLSTQNFIIVVERIKERSNKSKEKSLIRLSVAKKKTLWERIKSWVRLS